MKAVFPSPDPKARLDRRMHNLIAYARKVEGDMYGMANSRVSTIYYNFFLYNVERDMNFEITYYLSSISRMVFSKHVFFLFTVGVLPFASGKNLQNPKGTRGKTSKA